MKISNDDRQLNQRKRRRMTLTPYPEYQDSGVDWLGAIPSHWGVEPLFGEYEERQVKNTGLVEKTVLSLSYGRIIVKPPEKLHGLVPESFETYQIVEPGDIIIRPTDLQNDHTSLRIGFSQHCGIITSAYMCLRTWNDLTPDYGYHVLNVFDLTKAIYGYGSGLRQNLSFDHIKRVRVPVPPPDEQAAIVTFLDAAETRIRRYIRAKQKLIKLLNEQKQAIIQQAVTRGLNQDAPMKDSGVEWLGEIPSHWEVAGLGLLTITRCDGPFGSGLKSTHYTNEGVRVIRLQNIGNAEFRDKSKAYISPQHYATLGDHDVLQGDLLIAGLGDGDTPAGRACIAPDGIEPAMVKADCFRFRLKTDFLVPMYIAFQLSATAFTASAILSTGATRQRINLSSTSSRAIAFPNLDEQNAIVSYIFDATAPLEETINVIREEIKLIGEYRTRLIADVVTGKVDVRRLAFAMPEEFDEDNVYLDDSSLDVDEVFDDELEGVGNGED